MLACWDRLNNHEFDHSSDALGFVDRLARDNGWAKSFATRVVQDYRRFCFLAVYADHPVTPSDEVDQAWHLHLTYSRDYWEIFCPEVLGMSLHHGPTKGGPEEDIKYRYWYQQTLESYAKKFEKPDVDIWPEPAKRFADTDSFERLNTVGLKFVKQASINLAAPVSVVVLAISSMFALAGNDFAYGFTVALGFFTALLVIAVPERSRVKRGDVRRSSARSGGGCGGGGGGGGGG